MTEATAREPRVALRAVIHRIVPFLAVAMLIAALVVLHHELAGHRYREIRAALDALPLAAVALAAALTAAGYVALVFYDALALHYAGKPLGAPKTALASFVAYAFSHSLGFQLFTGGAVRYRLYSSWGLSTLEVTRVVAFTSVTYWLGLAIVGGSALTVAPNTGAVAVLPAAALARPVGILMLAVAAGYLASGALARGPIRIRTWEFAIPSVRLGSAQLVVGALDWSLAAGVLYVLLASGSSITYVAFVAIFVLAQVAGAASAVPGGLGVFDTIIVLLLSPLVPVPRVLAALVAYRAIYYLLPFVGAIIVLGVYEAMERRHHVTRLARTWASVLAPRVLSGAIFLAGAVLLVSGSAPSGGSRLAMLGRLLPLAVIEASHFAGSIIGLGLLILAWGLQRRLDAAYHLSVGFLAAGVVAALLRGFDWVAATVLALMLVALLPSRRFFYRKASLTSEPFTRGWVAAVALVLLTSTWLGLFAYQHFAFSGDLWWRFTLHGDAPRFLRATVGVFVVAGAMGLVRLLRAAPTVPGLPDETALAAAERVVATSTRASANLALLGDKVLLFNEDKSAFVMYGVSRRSWITFGDPVGPPEEYPDLAWTFHEIADRSRGTTVFYQVAAEHLPVYLELGLAPVKLGEEARVLLREFSLEGGARRGLRRTARRLEDQGYCFAVIPPTDVRAALPDLRRVSDAWLTEKHTREKGFSLGRFEPDYVRRFPAAVVRREGELVAFATLLPTARKTELSADLMRYAASAPPGVMDYLFARSMLWGREQGYPWFNLGMAPLAGIEAPAQAPLWHRLGAAVYRHGEHFYNFQGLRNYKAKFDPKWAPKYLATPRRAILPVVLTDVAALISGGLRGVVGK